MLVCSEDQQGSRIKKDLKALWLRPRRASSTQNVDWGFYPRQVTHPHHPYMCLDMASGGSRGVPAREGEQRRDEPRREDQGEQQAPAPQGPVLPPPPLVDYGVFMQGLVQAMQT
ncbi:hypothetical protein Taro_051586 [Colocasia esculenta]|uniref:Uncharacterized protein n=1 Tax=Colocasia esculenta TaxID=4460 RepID=A0A843XH99_COLES|nr:hypothetical protein [Colocasia esculenta]